MAVTTCTVSGTVVDSGGVAIQGAVIIASNPNEYFYGDGSLITTAQKSTTSAANGTWSLAMVENASTSTTTRVTVLYPDSTGTKIRRDYTITVPNSGTAAFATLAAGQ